MPSEIKKPSLGKRLFQRYMIDALGHMALGLFATLIIGTIFQQLGKIPGLSKLADFAAVAMNGSVVGAAIGVSIACGMKVKPLAMFASAVTGALGYAGGGGPLGSFIAAVIGAEAGNFLAGKTRVDIILVPAAAILAGGLTALLVVPGVAWLMDALRGFIDTATRLQPVWMGIVVSVVVGLALTAPISSAALCAMIFICPDGEILSEGLQLAAGAATVGCSCQMVGFAVTSFKENRWGGLIAQGLGTSMLQVPNIMKHPAILIPPTLASAILGPFATTLFDMRNYGTAAGMGTSGLVGQIGTWSMMAETYGAGSTLLRMLILHIALPAMLSFAICFTLRRMGWIKDGDMRLEL